MTQSGTLNCFRRSNPIQEVLEKDDFVLKGPVLHCKAPWVIRIRSPSNDSNSGPLDLRKLPNKDAIPQEVKGKFDNWAFGCDVCQDVCPWNRFSQPHREPLFAPHPELLSMTQTDWHEITESVFDRLFERSAVQRTRYEGLKRNLKFLKQA